MLIFSYHKIVYEILVGGGTAGCVLANRLSVDASVRVLLLEAGGQPTWANEIPTLTPLNQMTHVDWNYETEPQKFACEAMIGRRAKCPRGKVLGGSSSLNYMLYVRGNPLDYDRWEALGNDGWGWQGVFPYFFKAEGTDDPDLLEDGYHSKGL